jgi:transposase
MRGGKCGLRASAEDWVALERLARSSDRREADRARSILWSLDGQTGEMIGRTIGMRPDGVRRLRQVFASGGVDALRARRRTGRPGAKGAAALACAEIILTEPGETPWTLPRLKAEIARRCGIAISVSRLSIMLRKKGGSPGAALGTRSTGGRTRRRSSARASG